MWWRLWKVRVADVGWRGSVGKKGVSVIFSIIKRLYKTSFSLSLAHHLFYPPKFLITSISYQEATFPKAPLWSLKENSSTTFLHGSQRARVRPTFHRLSIERGQALSRDLEPWSQNSTARGPVLEQQPCLIRLAYLVFCFPACSIFLTFPRAPCLPLYLLIPHWKLPNSLLIYFPRIQLAR